MHLPARPRLHLRPLTVDDHADIALVAERMRETLVEVEGEEQGGGMYSLDWLAQRVRWHLVDRRGEAVVLVAETPDDGVIGHTLFRLETEPDGAPFGLITTTYVLPSARRGGVAQRLLSAAEAWFTEQGQPLCATWTSSTNTPLIELYRRNGYAEDLRGPNELTGTIMVRLARALDASPVPLDDRVTDAV